MSKATDSLMSYIRVAAGTWRNDPRDDAEVLARFAEIRDEAAFATLIGRHGPMVWRTCRAILGDTPDTEDAFQSTFLALSRQAGQSVIKNPVGWLYRVARRAALKARSGAHRKRRLEQELRDFEQPEARKDTGRDELYTAVDEELAGLPERLRVPLLLHYLEGKSQAEVARVLGCAKSVLQKRLAKGEKSLRRQLERRGLMLNAISMASLLGNTDGRSALPVRLIEGTARAAVAFRTGTLTGVAADQAQRLLRLLAIKKVAQACWWMVLACMTVSGIAVAGFIAWRMCEDSSNVVSSASPDAVILKANVELRNTGIDPYKDSLPKGAIARIGTTRFRGPCPLFGYLRNEVAQNGTALSSDCKMLAMAFDDGSISFWDVLTGKQLHKAVLGKIKLIGEGGLSSIDLSPDGKWLAASAETKRSLGVILLNTTTGQLKWPPLIPNTNEPAEPPLLGRSPTFSPDSKTLACIKWDGREGASIALYDVDTKKLLSVLKIGKIGISKTVFSQDGRTLAYIEMIEDFVGCNGYVHLLDIKTGKEKATLKGGSVITLAFTPDGNVVTAGKDKCVRVWDAKTGKELRQIGSMPELPTVVSLLSDGKTVLTACPGQISFRDVVSGKKSRPDLTCKELINPVLLSRDGTKLVERIGNAATLWDVSTGQKTGPGADAPRSLMEQLTFSPDSEMLATDAEFKIFEVEGGGAFNRLQEPGMSAFQLWEVTSGKSLGSLSAPLNVHVVDYNKVTWALRDTFLAQGFYKDGVGGLGGMGIFKWTPVVTKKDSYRVEVIRSGAIYLDEKVFVTGSGQNVQVRDLADDKTFATLPAFGKLFFSADHQLLVSQSKVREFASPVTLWDVTTGRKLYSVMMPEPEKKPDDKDRELPWENLVMLSPDGRLIITQNISNDRDNPGTHAISLWEHVSGRIRLRLPMPAECQDTNVAFSPDNRLLAIAYGSGQNPQRSIHIWNLTTGQECQRLQGHLTREKKAPKLVFSPDSRRLASIGMDYTALIWSVKPTAAGEEVSKPLSQKELSILKAALVGVDAEAAYRAICKLQQVPPEQAITLVGECMKPQLLLSVSEQVVQKVKTLISKLDSDDYETRTQAAKELNSKLNAEMGEPVVGPLLHQALEENPSVEASRAITNLLNETKEERKWGGSKSPELVRMFRGIEVLERINNGSTRKRLQELAAAAPRSEVRREAEAALKRLNSLPCLTKPLQSSETTTRE